MGKHGWNRGMLIATALVALAAWSLAPAARAATASTYIYDFEQTLKPWVAGTGSLLTLDQSDNLCPMELGTGMALLTVPVTGVAGAPGASTGGMAYMVAKFPANPGDTIAVDWAAKPEAACAAGDCKALVYAGANANPAAFSWSTVSGQHGAYGWQLYHYQAAMPRDLAAGDAVIVALGVTGQSQLTGVSLGVDCVQVKITANTN